MGLNFHYHDDLQQKMRAGMINEHECQYLFLLFSDYGQEIDEALGVIFQSKHH